MKSVDVSPLPKSEGGVALWHFETDFRLKIKPDTKNFKSMIQPCRSEVRKICYDSFAEFEKDFTKLKQNHTLIGIHVSSSYLSIYTGEQLGMRIQTLW